MEARVAADEYWHRVEQDRRAGPSVMGAQLWAKTCREEWAEMELTRYRRIRWRPPTASEKFFGRCGCGSGSQEPAIEEMQGPWL